MCDVEVAIRNLLRAGKELNFEVVAPFSYSCDGVNHKQTFAFIPRYGSENGTIVGLMAQSNEECDRDICRWAEANECFFSFLNMEMLLEYDVEYFKDMLKDWGEFGVVKSTKHFGK